MKSGSIAAHEAARNIEDATDGAEEPKRKRNAGPLAKGVAVDRIAAIHATAEERYQVALAEIRVADGRRMRAVLNRVPAADRAAAEKMLAALGIELPDAPLMKAPLYISADEIDDEPSVSDVADVADVAETPSRPALEEYDVGVALEATAVPRGAQPFVPGPAAQAAMKGRR